MAAAESPMEEPSFASSSDPLESMAPFPDPAPKWGQGSPRVDDISRLNATSVGGVFMCRAEEDVQAVIALARKLGKGVIVRGTQHSMGGQSIVPDGLIIDTRCMNHLSFDTKKKLLKAEAGARWCEVITYLNRYGMSPRTMQSYSTFSVGGTLAVNAHGITTDHPLSESVVSFRLVTASGDIVECSREAESDEARQLFRLALGGYGMFGVITSAVFKVDHNCPLEQQALILSVKEFPSVYKGVLQTPDVDIKLARIDITTMEDISLFVFRRTSDLPTVSTLPLLPREMSTTGKLLYKWLAPTMKEVRFAVERASGVALDWSADQALHRNTLMFESADPLAKLFDPLFQADDTFCLQEYFVPAGAFQDWIQRAKPIVRSMADSEQSPEEPSLLNITIRFLERDKDTALPYATCEEGMYAFVMYYRIPRSEAGDEALKRIHQQLTEVTLQLSGTFYLPYRPHYSVDQVHKAYPSLKGFMEAKSKFDPDDIFDSCWHRRYCQHTGNGSEDAGTAQAARFGQDGLHLENIKLSPSAGKLIVNSEAGDGQQFELAHVEERRSTSFRAIMGDAVLRREFRELFLVYVFNLKSAEAVYQLVAKACWNAANETDVDLYVAMQEILSSSGGPIDAASSLWRGLRQLRDQKDEILRETVQTVSYLGKLGHLQDYLSIGDNGKLVMGLRSALGLRGRVVVAHDNFGNDIPAVLERESVDPVGEEHYINYESIANAFSSLDRDSMDLITINQGLHHWPQNQLMKLLSHLRRILRPGGLLIIREHDCDETRHPNIRPLLDVAHMVFNVVTGVPVSDEKQERRAFRSILEWRTILHAAGFQDSMLYQRQATDPTWDEMMCFYKGPLWPDACHDGGSTPQPRMIKTIRSTAPVVLPQVSLFLSQLPAFVRDALLSITQTGLATIPSLKGLISNATAGLSLGQRDVVNGQVERFLDTTEKILSRFEPRLRKVELTRSYLNSPIIADLSLLCQALVTKARRGEASAVESLAASIILDIERTIAVGGKGASSEEEEDIPAGDDGSVASSAEPSSDQTRGSGDASGKSPTLDSVRIELRRLADRIPEIADPALVENLGLPTLAQRVANTMLESRLASSNGGQVLDQLSMAICEKLDGPAWVELKGAFEEVRQEGSPPTLRAMLDEASPWHRAALAFFGSPKVHFTASAQLQAALVGLADLMELWKEAQKARRDRDLEFGSGEDGSARVAPAVRRDIERHLRSYENNREITDTMEEHNFKDLDGVEEIVEAWYGYSSRTTGPVDVTQLLKERVLPDKTLRLSTLNLTKIVYERYNWFWSRLDASRLAALGKTRILRVTYKCSSETDVLRTAESIGSILRKHGLASPARVNDGHWGWFKLSEWMQVEMVKHFADSMEHTPWYRFPFADMLKLYGTTLSQVVKVVQSRHGWQKALMSSAFLVDAVPGVVMAGIFGQLMALALPLQLTQGSEYDPAATVEQLVVFCPPHENVEWSLVDDRRIVNSTRIVDGLHVLEVKTFKELTEVLKQIAAVVPDARVLQISNQSETQVRVECSEGRAEWFEREPPAGCTFMFKYTYPRLISERQELPVQVSLAVQVPHLLSLIRSISGMPDASLAQVYDFYN